MIKAFVKCNKQVALITGGTRGIGLGITNSLAVEGYCLALCGLRTESQVQEIIGGLRSKGIDVLYTQADVSLREDRMRLLASIEKRFGCLHVLVNNAGVAPQARTDILKATEDSFDRVMEINLKGPYFLIQAVANWMISQKKGAPDFKGCIVNISSISSTVASTDRGEYCLSKAGVGMMTKLWAVRLGEFGIPVYEIKPGIIMTDMTAVVKNKYDRLINQGLTIQPRWGFPDDVGKAVAMLIRGELPYSTGQVITVDGGLSIQKL